MQNFNVKKLLEDAKNLQFCQRFMFQHGKDPKHTSIGTIGWFRSKHNHMLVGANQTENLIFYLNS